MRTVFTRLPLCLVDSGVEMLFCPVVGCTDEMQVMNGWARRLNRDHLVVRCNWTRDEFHMKCFGNTWIGDVINCTQRRTSQLHFVFALIFLFFDSPPIPSLSLSTLLRFVHCAAAFHLQHKDFRSTTDDVTIVNPICILSTISVSRATLLRSLRPDRRIFLYKLVFVFLIFCLCIPIISSFCSYEINHRNRITRSSIIA